MSFDAFLAAAKAHAGTTITQWKPAYATILAQVVEDTLGSDNKAPLQHMSDTLVAVVQDALRSAPVRVRSVLRGGAPEQEGCSASTAADIQAAYLIGQLSFVQLVVSQACGHRADDDFLVTLNASEYQALLKVLKAGDATVTELEMANQAAGLAAGLVPGQLRVLISRGVCEYRGNADARLIEMPAAYP